MTSVWLDRNAGLCSGVRRAIRGAVEAAAHGGRRVVTYGELVHNPQVLQDLRERGIAEQGDLDRLQGDELVVIRTHGISPEEQAALTGRGLACLDLTCPRVKRAQRLAAAAAQAGEAVIVVGDPSHPEVRGLLGYAGPAARALPTPEQAAAYEGPRRAVVLAQTTITLQRFAEVAAVLEHRGFQVRSIDTRCPFVQARQAWIQKFARLAGASLILGGRRSSNTAKLHETALRYGPAYWVASPVEVDLPAVLRHPRLALTAGASTPQRSIAELVRRLRRAGAQVQPR
jgi:(E)-4-hydroxy-3-methyl-but-2-enyl pyrophosphate reductase